MKKQIWRFALFAFLAWTALLTFAPGAGLAAEVQEDDVAFQIDGAGAGFKINQKKNEITLGNCVVTDVHAHRTHWALPAQYKNRESIQRVFDEIRAGKAVALSREEDRAMREGLRDAFLYEGIMLECESPQGSSRYSRQREKPGRWYANMEILPMDGAAGDSFKDLVQIVMSVYPDTDKSGVVYIRSARLHGLIGRMSEEQYPPEALAGASAVTYYQASGAAYAAPSICSRWDGCATDDAQAIGDLADALMSAQPIEARIRIMPQTLLRFSLPEDEILSVIIAAPEFGATDPDRTLAVLGGGLYELDRDAWVRAMTAANLPHKVR